MPEKPISPEFETSLRRALEVPGPEPQFVDRLRSKLEQEKANNMQPQKRTFSPRLAWGLAAMVGILTLGLLAATPSVVEAVKRLFGYVPGAGVVEQTVSLRALSAPVIVERDGVTLTVLQAVVASDKTSLTYQVENIPASAMAGFTEGGTPTPFCNWNDNLRLPDGSILSISAGQGVDLEVGSQYILVFDPLPADVNEATLLISCLPGTMPGAAPENWEIPLTFVPAPSDLVVLPVIEVTPSVEATEAATASPLRIESVVELEDGYLLFGSVSSITLPNGLVTSPYIWNIRFTDANGQEVPYEYPADVVPPVGDAQTSPWVYKIPGKDHAWPLTITLEMVNAVQTGEQASFEFETGAATQEGQAWTINQDLQVGDYALRVLTAERTANGYKFTFESGDAAVIAANVDIQSLDQNVIVGGGGGGGGGGGTFEAGLSYRGQVPEGTLTVVVCDVTLLIPDTWSVQWMP